jgi:beta-lactamase regulating signal transducer with metallopeptidase domain
MSPELWVILKASAVLGFAALIQGALGRRTSAATRHLVWTLAIFAVIVLPILSFALPPWVMVVPVAPTTTADAGPVMDRVRESVTDASPASLAATSPATASATPRAVVPWTTVFVSVYTAGLLVMLMYLAIQRRSLRRLNCEASEVEDAEWTWLVAECARSMEIQRRVHLLRSREHSMPMAFGTFRPAIVIPAIADTWSYDRRRAVVMHELAHVARFDCLTQTLAFVACAIYWFHPGAWWAARRLRIEREIACDDRVIAAGAQAREYAGHLLEIAYAFSSQRAPALAVGMARARQLEGRMLAVLDAARDRSVPAIRLRVASVAVVAAVLVPVATVTATRAPAGADVDRFAAIATPREELAQTADAAIASKQPQLPGTWEIRPSTVEGTVHLRLVEMGSSFGTDVPIARLEGLTGTRLTDAGGPVQFRLRRDAGTFTFEGVVRSGVGAGTFSFAADQNFPAELVKRGFARPTALEQYRLARHDVGFAFVDELNTQGYAKPETAELVRAGQHGVQLAYLREMGALGYRLGSLAPLIRLRDHGVTPAYIRELAALGYKGLPADAVRTARDHGVTSEYVRAMRDAGYGSLPMEQLITARDHGVTEEYIRALADAGHRKLPLDQVIRARDHGVSSEYARDMRQLGYGVPIDELIRARDHGLTAEFVRDMAALGYGGQVESLIRVRDHGVTPEYVREVKALGYDRVAIEDLVTLRDHGLTADRIRAANTRAGTRLPIDMLTSFAAGGMR